MSNMRKLILLLWFFLGSNIFAMQDQEAVEDESPKPVRVAFFIDDTNEMFECDGKIGITRDFALTLSQEALDIVVVSNYILKNLILRKYTKNPDSVFTGINFDLKKWDIYLVDNTQFFVLVPRDSDNPIFNKKFLTKINLSKGKAYSGVGDDSYPKISWADNAPIEAKRLLSNNNFKYIPYAKDVTSEINGLGNSKTEHKKFEPSQLFLIFTPPSKETKTVVVDKKPFKYELYDLSSLPPCNIYIIGHGNYSTRSSIFKVAGMSANDMVNVLLFFNDKLNTKSVRLSSCYSGGEILDLMRIKNDIPIRVKYLFIVDSITDTETTTSVEGDDYDKTALSEYFDAVDDFLNGCKSFVDKLNIIRAKKKTTPPEEIKSEIKNLEKNSGFEKILRKLSLPNDWYFYQNGLANFPQIWIPEIGWFQTFDIDSRVQKITDVRIVKTLATPEFIENEKVEIEDARKTPPQIKKVTIKSRLKKMHFAESGTIEIYGALALLLYSEVVFANITVFPCKQALHSEALLEWLSDLYKHFPSIPCLDSVCVDKPLEKVFYFYPQIISMQRKDGLNLFAKISIIDTGKPEIQTGILNFLRDSFLILRGRKSKKTFFIKELEGYNDFSEILNDENEFKKELTAIRLEKQKLTLQNVFVSTFTDDVDDTHIDISFDFEGKGWVLSCQVGAFADLIKNTLGRTKGKLPLRWHFKENKNEHEKNLNLFGLAYLAKLTPVEYYAQLQTIRDNFKKQNTKMLKEFIVDLNSEAILKLKLRELKISLDTLKQKLLILNLKLDQLKSRLTCMA